MSGYLVPKPVQHLVTAASFGSQKWAHWRPADGTRDPPRLARARRARRRPPRRRCSRRRGRRRGRPSPRARPAAIGSTGLAVARRVPAVPAAPPRPRRRGRGGTPRGSRSPAPAYHGIGIPACVRQARTNRPRPAETADRRRRMIASYGGQTAVAPASMDPDRHGCAGIVDGARVGRARRLRWLRRRRLPTRRPPATTPGDRRRVDHDDRDDHDRADRATHVHQPVDATTHHEHLDVDDYDDGREPRGHRPAPADRAAARRVRRRTGHRGRLDRDPGDRRVHGDVRGDQAHHPRLRPRSLAGDRDAGPHRQHRDRRAPHEQAQGRSATSTSSYPATRSSSTASTGVTCTT